jgi:uroporphyrin-3 C-methyltransferase
LKTAIFSLIIALGAGLFSLFQFEKYQALSAEMHSNFQQLNESVNSSLEALAKNMDRIASKEPTQNNPWVLTESEYLVNSAALRLQTVQDVKTATLLISTALHKIQSLKDPNLLTLQDALTKDLALLQNTSSSNTADIWLKASTLIDMINQLPLRANPSFSASQLPIETSTTLNPQTQSSWKQALLESWKQIKELVKVRRYTKPIEPLLSSTEQSLIKENLRLMLEQIRSSILTKEMKIYLKGIQDMQQWLSQYFDENDVKVKEVQNVLNALTELNLQPEMPTMTSLEQFNALRQ